MVKPEKASDHRPQPTGADHLSAAGFAATIEALPVPPGRTGPRMRDVFAIAKRFIDLPTSEIDELLNSDIHEVRVGALSIMGKKAMRRSTPDSVKGELFDLYLRRTDRINTWDLVDVSAHQVVGGYLVDRPRESTT